MHVDKSVNLFEDITFEVKEQFRFFNDEQKVSVLIVSFKVKCVDIL